jgi:aspartate/methionine/tyrosine aminotransferase
MRFPEIAYQRWFKEGAAAGAELDLAGSGVPPFPAARLPLRRSHFSTHHAPGYGWPPLVEALAERYRVATESVVPVTGGASLANWLAIAAALEGSTATTEVIVERPAYEPLRRIPESFGCRVRRLDRRHSEGWTVDLDRLRELVRRRTRLLVLTDLHNPSGVALEREVLRSAAEMLARVGGWVLVVEVYGETLWADATDSAARSAPNIVATNSLTKAHGLDGLRAGWLLAPPELARRARRIHDHLGVNPVATADRMALVALRNLELLRARVARRLATNRGAWKSFLGTERRLESVEPAGGTVAFPRLPRGLDGDAFAAHLLARHSTRVVPGSFFEAKRHFRIGFTAPPATFRAALPRLARALDELS